MVISEKLDKETKTEINPSRTYLRLCIYIIFIENITSLCMNIIQ